VVYRGLDIDGEGKTRIEVHTVAGYPDRCTVMQVRETDVTSSLP
jgi:hypothetical protein